MIINQSKKIILLCLCLLLGVLIVACSESELTEELSEEKIVKVTVVGEGEIKVAGERVSSADGPTEVNTSKEEVSVEVTKGHDDFIAYNLLGDTINEQEYNLVLSETEMDLMADFTSASSFNALDLDDQLEDQGLHWFKSGDEAKRYVPGQENPYYNPDKPTLIYVHGWGANRDDFIYHDPETGEVIDTSKAWIADGWNVGVFYWNRFSDEEEVEDAEAKIWSEDGPENMRWKNDDDEYVAGPKLSAAEMFYQDYISALADYSGDEIRIAGLSLGNQMAVQLTNLVEENINDGNISNHLRPDRVALLDPYWSNDSKDYLNGDWTGERVRWAVEELKESEILFEQYRSSIITGVSLFGDVNNDLTEHTAFTELKPWHISSWNIEETAFARHEFARDWYFWSYAFAAPEETEAKGYIWDRRNVPTGEKALSASTSNQRVSEMMTGDYSWDQVEGRNTATPEDNYFKIIKD